MLSMKNDGLLNRTVRHGALTPTDSNAIWEHQPMTIYRNRIYRRIYEQHHGPIPKGHHIHHIDGDHTNNNIDNLKCVTSQEHYNIHKSQGDWGSCWAMLTTGHVSLTPEEKSEIASFREMEKVKSGEHRFLDPDFVSMVAEINSNRLKELAKEGKHPAQSEKNRKSFSKRSEKKQKELSDSGNHVWQSKEHREKLSSVVAESNRRRAGFKWWNNGVKNKQSKECPGEEWILGRVKK
jgi:hypothetical protein